MNAAVQTRTLRVVYIQPSRYDDDGYVHRYWRGLLPSNTLSCLRDLTAELARTGELGGDVAVHLDFYDEVVQRIPIRRILRRSRRNGEHLVVGLVGVQSGMFPRATDLALAFRAGGADVLIGGFHVSGVLKLFEETPPDLQRLLDHGVTLVQGEVEGPGVLAGILRDALHGTLEPIYRITDAPDISEAPIPMPDPDYQRRFMQSMGTMDTSRGCPFNCSFCTIINVQGRKMRSRSADTMLKSIEENYARGFRVYFFTDDNLSRSPVWEELFDGLIDMTARGKPIRFMMQVDTQAPRIPHFVEKAAAAGCYQVFVGMESVNPANMEATGKKQNKVSYFPEMVAAWRRAKILVHVGYIIGLPHDTPESVPRDIEMLKDTMKVDEASFFMLTPIPGSRDHLDMVRNGVPLDADYNDYDSFHETFRHPNFKPGQWRVAYEDAWDTFYSKENLVNILLRAPAHQYWNIFWLCLWARYSALFRLHPMLMGFIRFKGRKERRPCFAREGVFAYLRRRAGDMYRHARIILRMFFEYQEIWLLTRRKDDPRWTTLADLRARWSDAQQRLTESDLAGRCDLAAKELRDVLRNAADSLERLSSSGRHLNRHLRRRLHAKAKETEAYLRRFELQMPTWTKVVQVEQYITDSLLAGYEELAIRYVAKRRRFNGFRRDLVQRLKTGRILSMNVLTALRVLAFELVMGLRFGIESLTQLQSGTR